MWVMYLLGQMSSLFRQVRVKAKLWVVKDKLQTEEIGRVNAVFGNVKRLLEGLFTLLQKVLKIKNKNFEWNLRLRPNLF